MRKIIAWGLVAIASVWYAGGGVDMLKLPAYHILHALGVL